MLFVAAMAELASLLRRAGAKYLNVPQCVVGEVDGKGLTTGRRSDSACLGRSHRGERALRRYASCMHQDAKTHSLAIVGAEIDLAGLYHMLTGWSQDQSIGRHSHLRLWGHSL